MQVPAANRTFFFAAPPRVSGRGGDPRVFPEASLGVLIAFGEPSGAMAEEQRDLISDRGSGVLSVGDTQRCHCWGHGVGAQGEGEVGTVGTWGRGYCVVVGWKRIQSGKGA